jgi:hypothetical protein
MRFIYERLSGLGEGYARLLDATLSRRSHRCGARSRASRYLSLVSIEETEGLKGRVVQGES